MSVNVRSRRVRNYLPRSGSSDDGFHNAWILRCGPDLVDPISPRHSSVQRTLLKVWLLVMCIVVFLLVCSDHVSWLLGYK
jgi:hypothetical protein